MPNPGALPGPAGFGPAMRVRFGSFILDRSARLLLADGEPRPLEPKAFEMLDLLVSRRPAAVSKQEIRDRVWPQTFVSESTLSSLAAQVRRALDAGGKGPMFLRTVHGFGYAFDAEATEEVRGRVRVAAHLEWERGVSRLAQGENVIGRDDDVAVQIDVAGVSRHHARIIADGARFTLEDLGSKNGTYLRDQRLVAPSPLEDGDSIRLGRTRLVFRVKPAPRSTRAED